MAACYLLLNFEWELLPHQLCCVTAGSPRSVLSSMQAVVDKRLHELEPMNKASFHRIVLNEDVVVCYIVGSCFALFCTEKNTVSLVTESMRTKHFASVNCTINEQTKVPPRFLGFEHVGNLVYITEEGEVLIRPDESNRMSIEDDQAKEVCQEKSAYADMMGTEEKKADEDDNDDNESLDSSSPNKPNPKYERLIKMIPGALKDHMPDFYLQPLVRLCDQGKNGLATTTSLPAKSAIV